MKACCLRGFIFGLVLAGSTPLTRGQQPAEYRGTLEPRLVPYVPPFMGNRVRAATDDERGGVKIGLAAADRVSVADVGPLVKGPDFKAALVERPGGAVELLLDLNRDGSWTADERTQLVSSVDPADPPGSLVARFDVPLPAGHAYPSYPLMLMVSRRQQSGQQPASTVLYQSGRVAVQGTVDIEGRRTLVRYTSVNLRTGVIDPNADWLEVDCDGDGRIDTTWTSPETSFANGRPVVFKVGSRYVSTAIVDTATHSIVMRSHPASDYDRIELSVGAQVPDFQYFDFDGKARKLSDTRGQYVLLDFWGSWCSACISRFPELKDVYATYHARGFEILGMDKEDWEGDESAAVIEKARAVIADKALPWLQTRPDSVKRVIERFHIVPYPTYILLDRQGRIVSWGAKGQPPLDGPELATTLEKVLPKQAGSGKRTSSGGRGR